MSVNRPKAAANSFDFCGFRPEMAWQRRACALLKPWRTMTTNATAPTSPAADEAPKKSRKVLVLVSGVVLLVLLGGGGAAYWMYAKAPAEGEAKPKHEEPAEPGIPIALDPFVVNLADLGGTRFLRVNLSLVVKDEEEAKLFEEAPVNKIKVRSVVLELLALQTADQLVTPAGKAALKKAIAGAAAKAVKEVHITDVLFSEFVVQF
jgi:flagellar protein FliL